MDQALWNSLGVGQDGLDKLHAFAALVQKWTVRINLVARSTLPDLWARHIEDSARLCLCAPQSPKVWADFGAGGGYPGIVVATVLQARGAATRVILVESDQRKAAFLREAARTLHLPVEVHTERAETLPPLTADVVSARALTALDGLCGLAQRHLAPQGVAIFPKGETYAEEITEARKNWRFDLETVIDPRHKGAILCLRNITRALH
ncbi:16S rRNA (guanine(527)-N(7))-methyltransferase RsmG [Rhodobacter sp. Har01]|uniref:16S rRNA (guanine(527)-N(7))-methyltransferase RsmG n=1 Tax=Rhodobacter sp. Har01 TaxID=2883999 RepID=UPI001D077ADA|nr:16S rRNA (guanine(527)-N(7))-methyltransferase RsmG [Rhodobacter sp. Har01]MCB6177997.1 16S rRNA (guanine(527)-N(7))-methyltransferase RsmG [Rhodobacter sp. Har01]